MSTTKDRSRRSTGTGSLYTIKGKRRESWYATITLPNGRQRKRRLGPVRAGGQDGLTRTQAEAALRELIATATVEPAARRPTGRTLADVWEAFELDAQRRGLKATTLGDYRSVVRRRLLPFFGEDDVATIGRDDVARFVAELGRDRLSAKSTINYTLVLSTLMTLAVRRGWITSNPVAGAELPSLQRHVDELEPLRFLEVYEVADLAQHAQDGPYAALDRALYTAAALTGLRQGELLGLRWRQVDVTQARVRVIGAHVRGQATSPKSHKARSVPLAATVARALEELRAVSPWTALDDHVFADPITGGPLARTPLMARYRQSLQDAGLDPAFRFHDLRHTFGTTMARAGEPVTTIAAWMGHADIRTTQIYLHYAPAVDEAERIEQAFTLADPRADVLVPMPEADRLTG